MKFVFGGELVVDINDWSKVINLPQASQLKLMVYKTIKDAAGEGLSYEEVYTALHKMIDLQLYEFEVMNFL